MKKISKNHIIANGLKKTGICQKGLDKSENL